MKDIFLKAMVEEMEKQAFLPGALRLLKYPVVRKVVGGAAGTIIGGALGGPIGAAAGGTLGSMVP